MYYSIDEVLTALGTVIYPESEKSIVDLDMIIGLKSEGKKIAFTIKLPKANVPFKKSLEKACVQTLQDKLSKEIEVDIDFIFPVQTGRIDEKKVLPGVKNIIAVASGKGGVGKSTVSTNLAVALAGKGYKTGLIDADIYGPSQPKMFGVENIRPEVRKEGNTDIIVPVEKYGVKMLSIGFFVDPDNALIWRGPMATGALQQLINQGDWGELDYLLIDLPPGTSDIHLTMVQEVPVTGAVIVSTPQKVATADAIKGINMFRADKIEVPVLGLIENMAWFTPAELPDNKYYLFGKNGCKELSERTNIPFLGQIPIVQSIMEGSDAGKPSASDANTLTGQAFIALADNLIERIAERNEKLAPTQKVEITNTDGCAAS